MLEKGLFIHGSSSKVVELSLVTDVIVEVRLPFDEVKADCMAMGCTSVDRSPVT